MVQDFVATDITRSSRGACEFLLDCRIAYTDKFHCMPCRTVQPTFIPVILMYWIIQCINTVFFAQRCYIATGRRRIIGGILGTLGGSFIVTSIVASVVGSMAFLTDGVQLPVRSNAV